MQIFAVVTCGWTHSENVMSAPAPCRDSHERSYSAFENAGFELQDSSRSSSDGGIGVADRGNE